MKDKINKSTLEAALIVVRNALIQNGGEQSSLQPFRRRSRHCQRVLNWCERLMAHESCIFPEPSVLRLSAVFHDAGYNDRAIPHEELGTEIFLRFSMEQGLPEYLTRQVADNIRHHSNKEEIHASDTPPERLILMEADLLDEEGSMGIVVDCFTHAHNDPLLTGGYSDLLDHLQKNAGAILDSMPMVTPYAIACWKKKQSLVSAFLQTLADDVMWQDLR